MDNKKLLNAMKELDEEISNLPWEYQEHLLPVYWRLDNAIDELLDNIIEKMKNAITSQT